MFKKAPRPVLIVHSATSARRRRRAPHTVHFGKSEQSNGGLFQTSPLVKVREIAAREGARAELLGFGFGYKFVLY